MKNLNYFFALIIILLAFLIYSEYNRNIKLLNNIEALKQAQIIDSISRSAITSQVKDYSSYAEKVFEIEYPAARAMVNAFLVSQEKCRKDAGIPKDKIERSVYFKREILDKFIKENIGANKDIGLRIYFGQYEDTKIVNDYLKGQLGEEKAIEFMKLNKDRISVILTLTNDKGEVIEEKKLLNLGGLCPPNCPTDWADPLKPTK